MKFFIFIFTILFISLTESKPRTLFVSDNSGATCGYSSCPAYNASATINVHLVPHSHDDVGWLKTVDQYYFGSKMSIQRAGVQYILDSVIKELATDPSKRFIQVETAFFWRWWNEQNDIMKDITRKLVEEGRLEFVGAGWSMNDEATTHYSGIIDNMALGFKTLGDEFGECAVPRVAWQIDPFGHSREQARIFAQMGFDGLFFARADYRDKKERLDNQTLQMLWHGSGHDEGHEENSLFTGMFSSHYSHPVGLCFDVLCTDEPIVDNLELEDVNVEERIFTFMLNTMGEASFFKGPSSKHIMFTMGDDFQYMNARQNYKNMDKLIKHANEILAPNGINVFYSTPSCFIKAINEEANRQNFTDWPTKTDDFFPYASGKHSYWSGYFTSRPTLKYMERYTNGFLQLSKQVEALFEFNAKISGEETAVDILRRAMATMQHHDAVTGTEKQHVAEDYALRMSEGTESALAQVGPALFGKIGQVPPPGSNQFLCPLLNISACELTENNSQLSMIIYNPLARSVSKTLRFPVKSGMNVRVFNAEGESLNVVQVPVPLSVKTIPGRSSEAEFDAVFLASDIPALGFRAFYVSIEPATNFQPPVTRKLSKEEMEMFTKEVGVSVSTGFYVSSSDLSSQPSGAYVFRPENETKILVNFDQFEMFESDLVNEIHASSSEFPWASKVYRINSVENHLEVEWLVGPLPDVNPGIEVVLTYTLRNTSDPGDQVEFWTDSNGRQMVQRIKDQRSYYFPEGDLEPIASNYYPITTGLFKYVTDQESEDNITLIILNDRSQGGTCLKNDECELMVHRRTFEDDRFGVGEALDEHAFGQPLVARGKHYIGLGPNEEVNVLRRLLSQELYMPPFIFFLPTTLTLEEWIATPEQKQFRGLSVESLQTNLHILTLERWGNYENNEVLIRFEHLFEEGEHPELSLPVTFELTSDFFSSFTINSVREMSLGGNVEKESVKNNRMLWKHKTRTNSEDGPQPKAELPLSITLEPMEIRTFILNIAPPAEDVLLEIILP